MRKDSVLTCSKRSTKLAKKIAAQEGCTVRSLVESMLSDRLERFDDVTRSVMMRDLDEIATEKASFFLDPDPDILSLIADLEKTLPKSIFDECGDVDLSRFLVEESTYSVVLDESDQDSIEHLFPELFSDVQQKS